jgi:hypothetical protein
MEKKMPVSKSDRAGVAIGYHSRGHDPIILPFRYHVSAEHRSE